MNNRDIILDGSVMGNGAYPGNERFVGQNSSGTGIHFVYGYPESPCLKIYLV